MYSKAFIKKAFNSTKEKISTSTHTAKKRFHDCKMPQWNSSYDAGVNCRRPRAQSDESPDSEGGGGVGAGMILARACGGLFHKPVQSYSFICK